MNPPNAAVVAPWQIAAIAPPAFTIGLGLTVKDLFAEVVEHKPPLVVRVKITDCRELLQKRYTLLFPAYCLPLLANVPPAPPSDHTAAVAPPLNEPPKAAVVAPWQIAVVVLSCAN